MLLSTQLIRRLIRESIRRNLSEGVVSQYPNIDLEVYHSTEDPPDKFLKMMNRMPEEDIVTSHMTTNKIDGDNLGFVGQTGNGSGMYGVGFYTSLYGGENFDSDGTKGLYGEYTYKLKIKGDAFLFTGAKECKQAYGKVLTLAEQIQKNPKLAPILHDLYALTKVNGSYKKYIKHLETFPSEDRPYGAKIPQGTPFSDILSSRTLGVAYGDEFVVYDTAVLTPVAWSYTPRYVNNFPGEKVGWRPFSDYVPEESESYKRYQKGDFKINRFKKQTLSRENNTGVSGGGGRGGIRMDTKLKSDNIRVGYETARSSKSPLDKVKHLMRLSSEPKAHASAFLLGMLNSGEIDAFMDLHSAIFHMSLKEIVDKDDVDEAFVYLRSKTYEQIQKIYIFKSSFAMIDYYLKKSNNNPVEAAKKFKEYISAYDKYSNLHLYTNKKLFSILKNDYKYSEHVTSGQKEVLKEFFDLFDVNM